MGADVGARSAEHRRACAAPGRTHHMGPTVRGQYVAPLKASQARMCHASPVKIVCRANILSGICTAGIAGWRALLRVGLSADW